MLLTALRLSSCCPGRGFPCTSFSVSALHFPRPVRAALPGHSSWGCLRDWPRWSRQRRSFFTVILAALVLGERPGDRRSWARGGRHRAGLVGGRPQQLFPLAGFVLTVCAAASWAVGNLVSPLALGLQRENATGIRRLVGRCRCRRSTSRWWGHGRPRRGTGSFGALDVRSWASVAYLAFGATLAGFGLWNRLCGTPGGAGDAIRVSSGGGARLRLAGLRRTSRAGASSWDARWFVAASRCAGASLWARLMSRRTRSERRARQTIGRSTRGPRRSPAEVAGRFHPQDRPLDSGAGLADVVESEGPRHAGDLVCPPPRIPPSSTWRVGRAAGRWRGPPLHLWPGGRA